MDGNSGAASSFDYFFIEQVLEENTNNENIKLNFLLSKKQK